MQRVHKIDYLKCLGAAICKWFAALLVFIGFSTSALAEQFHAHEDIQKTAKNFVYEHLKRTHDKFEVHINALDQRLKLSRCETPLEAFFPPGARLYGKTTVGVRCTDEKPWKIFVPATLALYEKVLAASRTIVRGEVLGSDDLTLVSKPVGPASQSHFRSAKQAIGFIAKRSIPVGKILTAHMVQAPRLVQAGQEVILLATTPQLEVRMKGKALSDGSEGDLVRVRNVRSKRVVEGIVMQTGIVRVNM
ncbi:MAG: flagellar basal body P-ring formation chaperone FlgA [Gammaproteobacteria bacterium]|jgi:flagella basal body P-ring formation protein FlgA